MRKLRTRQHIIEDLGFNYIERQVLYAGYVIQRSNHNDYGYDGIIHTFNSVGEIEQFSIIIQLKSTDNMRFVSNKSAFAFDLSVRDLELWLQNSLPVILILYDAIIEKAYFLDLQSYFKDNRLLLKNIRKFVRVYVPQSQVFDKINLFLLRQSIN